ncbi:hypothetical protein Pfo_009638, partial [Paulownia fortunei]
LYISKNPKKREPKKERNSNHSLMACSCDYSSKTLISSWRKIISVVFIGFFLLNSCVAIRPGRTMMMVMKENDVSAMALKYFQENKEKLPADGLYFTRLPKGVPIPPSGPSKRHNSSPQN